ncbi:MAG: hypothetical protein JWO06_1304, partial [Bacteroidota bacterium]|nr:hypothetical protein [Bacteroidota bacterium]
MKKKTTIITIDQPAKQQKPGPQIVFEPKMWFAVISAAVGFLLYANTIGNNYVLDDNGIILDNQYIQQGFKGLGGIFTTDVWHFQNVDLGYCRPLSLATFAIENQFFGQNPHVSHFDNLLLFALTGFFLCLLLMRVFRNYNPLFALVISLLFLAHPVHTEVVANIKSRDEILSFLNLVIAIYILLRAVSTSATNYKLLALSGFFFYLALLSKETALIGFILVPVILFFTGKYNLKEILVRTVPFIVLVLVFQLQKYAVLGSISGSGMKDLMNYPYTDPGAKLPSMFLIFSWCIKLLLIPYPLSYSYAYNQIPAADWTNFGTFAGVLFAVTLVYFVYKGANKKSPVALGIAIGTVTLAPAMMFVLLRGGIFAERFLYAPVLGLVIVLAWLIFKMTKIELSIQEPNFKKPGLIAPLLIIFGLYSFITISRNRDWKDQLSISGHDVNVTAQ